jgi:hypothetical protein
MTDCAIKDRRAPRRSPRPSFVPQSGRATPVQRASVTSAESVLGRRAECRHCENSPGSRLSIPCADFGVARHRGLVSNTLLRRDRDLQLAGWNGVCRGDDLTMGAFGDGGATPPAPPCKLAKGVSDGGTQSGNFLAQVFPDRRGSVLARRAREGKIDARVVDTAIGVRLEVAGANRSNVPKSVAERDRRLCAHKNGKTPLLGRKSQ